jgi:hypothetical protein
MKPYPYDQESEMMTKEEQAAWSKIEEKLYSVKPIKPRKGFAGRWLLVSEKRELAERKHRELWLALANGTAILAILGVIAIFVWPVFSQPASFFVNAFESLLDGITFVVIFIGVGLSLVQDFPLIAWLLLAAAFFCLLALWASLFSRIRLEIAE